MFRLPLNQGIQQIDKCFTFFHQNFSESERLRKEIVEENFKKLINCQIIHNNENIMPCNQYYQMKNYYKFLLSVDSNVTDIYKMILMQKSRVTKKEVINENINDNSQLNLEDKPFIKIMFSFNPDQAVTLGNDANVDGPSNGLYHLRCLDF